MLLLKYIEKLTVYSTWFEIGFIFLTENYGNEK